MSSLKWYQYINYFVIVKLRGSKNFLSYVPYKFVLLHNLYIATVDSAIGMTFSYDGSSVIRTGSVWYVNSCFLLLYNRSWLYSVQNGRPINSCCNTKITTILWIRRNSGSVKNMKEAMWAQHFHVMLSNETPQFCYRCKIIIRNSPWKVQNNWPHKLHSLSLIHI